MLRLVVYGLLGFRLRGRPAWAIYRMANLLKLVGWKNKLRAGTTLAINRIIERDLSIIGHPEPDR